MTKRSIHLIEKGQILFLVHESGIKVPVSNDVRSALKELNDAVAERESTLKDIGLEDEVSGFSLSRLPRNQIITSLIQGCAFALPVFLAFTIGTVIVVGSVKRASSNLSELLNPNSLRNDREEISFQARVEKFRPYLGYFLKVYEEEKAKVSNSTQSKQ